ncbi:NADH dehydrogenase [ubiquinone] 1 alpha subcomplex subunit 5-like [Zalophus californianus]|uniref:NADH dehydrogenase [ubiquinone] 1 alpha subcomplex subunit 5 n=1 Tax=Zalophus californianus TaxID=9704 RepID=A0A6P9FGY8_ZALCA|nr:NADH dehydrogenase [ubiquinone] 1 alpha subcomplex subunit 5-like [Zalophus californianus]
MAGLLKKTTGLVGLAVCESPHERLRILYTKILDVLEQIPKNAGYRKYTEQITNEKLSMVKVKQLNACYMPCMVVGMEASAYIVMNKTDKNPCLLGDYTLMVGGKEEPDVKKLEDQLQGGQLEEVILQAENELSLARKMLQWKPWEALVKEPPANQWKWPI